MLLCFKPLGPTATGCESVKSGDNNVAQQNILTKRSMGWRKNWHLFFDMYTAYAFFFNSTSPLEWWNGKEILTSVDECWKALERNTTQLGLLMNLHVVGTGLDLEGQNTTSCANIYLTRMTMVSATFKIKNSSIQYVHLVMWYLQILQNTHTHTYTQKLGYFSTSG